MKIKLLVVPSLIALIVVLSIWLVYPAYSNGSTGVRDNYNKLKSEQVKLDSLRGKSGNVSKFTSQLDALSSNKDVLYNFVPESMNESEIVDNLNKMAVDSGLLVYGITINQPKLNATTSVAPETLGTTSLSDTSGNIDSPVASALPTVKSFETDMSVSGNYLQIKDFLNKANSFARYSDIATLSLKTQLLTSATGNSSEVAPPSVASGGAVPSTLMAAITMDFDMLQKATLSNGNVDDPVFSGENLDTQIISKIKDRYNVLALPLSVGQKGNSDIFTP